MSVDFQTPESNAERSPITIDSIQLCKFKRAEESTWEVGIFISGYSDLIVDGEGKAVIQGPYDLFVAPNWMNLPITEILKSYQDRILNT